LELEIAQILQGFTHKFCVSGDELAMASEECDYMCCKRPIAVSIDRRMQGICNKKIS